MEKDKILLLAGYIFKNRSDFEFHTDNGVDLTNVTINLKAGTVFELALYGENKNKVIFNFEKFYFENNTEVTLPKYLQEYLEITSVGGKLMLKETNCVDWEIMEAFQICFNRIEAERKEKEDKKNEEEKKLIAEMKKFDVNK
jgi:predicted nucleotidyltransferase